MKALVEVLRDKLNKGKGDMLVAANNNEEIKGQIL
jgi:hypothetical protein